MQNKINCGSKFYMLVEDMPVGVVSVKECLIEDLYILPDNRKWVMVQSYCNLLLRNATGIPTLWILENNTNAKRLYHKMGFQETGRVHAIAEELDALVLISITSRLLRTLLF